MRREVRARRWVLRELERIEQRRSESPTTDRAAESAEPDPPKATLRRVGGGQS